MSVLKIRNESSFLLKNFCLLDLKIPNLNVKTSQSLCTTDLLASFFLTVTLALSRLHFITQHPASLLTPFRFSYIVPVAIKIPQ